MVCVSGVLCHGDLTEKLKFLYKIHVLPGRWEYVGVKKIFYFFIFFNIVNIMLVTIKIQTGSLIHTCILFSAFVNFCRYAYNMCGNWLLVDYNNNKIISREET